MKLLVRNLARTTTESELIKLFEIYGTVQSCSLVIDKDTGTSKGFGFIEMPSSGEAKAAVKTLNGKEISGHKIRVKKAQPKPATQNSSENKVSKSPGARPSEPSMKKPASTKKPGIKKSSHTEQSEGSSYKKTEDADESFKRTRTDKPKAKDSKFNPYGKKPKSVTKPPPSLYGKK